jgi:hypothetical protein
MSSTGINVGYLIAQVFNFVIIALVWIVPILVGIVIYRSVTRRGNAANDAYKRGYKKGMADERAKHDQ